MGPLRTHFLRLNVKISKVNGDLNFERLAYHCSIVKDLINLELLRLKH